RAGHPRDAVDPRHLGVGVVEQHAVADLHAVLHEVARLVVAHAGPRFGAHAREIVDGEVLRFGLHQPVAGARAHRRSVTRVLDSVQIASGRTSQSWTSSAPVRWASKPTPTSHGGAAAMVRNAKLRSYQPPPMPSR